jgi:hypothetical protein
MRRSSVGRLKVPIAKQFRGCGLNAMRDEAAMWRLSALRRKTKLEGSGLWGLGFRD